jgi:hypothetical protein
VVVSQAEGGSVQEQDYFEGANDTISSILDWIYRAIPEVRIGDTTIDRDGVFFTVATVLVALALAGAVRRRLRGAQR